MHEYLKAIGFSNLKTKKELKRILLDVEESFHEHEMISLYEEVDFCEFRKKYGDNFGIAVCGELDENDIFEKEYYYPYFKGEGITSYSDIVIEKRMEKEMYVGICEDVKVGVNLIFHLQNMMEYRRQRRLGNLHKISTSVTLSGLADKGTVLFPILKSPAQEQNKLEESRNRMMLLSAAKNGDQKAMESLTLDDIDTYSQVVKRLVTEDIFSIVDTYFMPYGVECDRYSIMGTILDIKETENNVTKESVYILTLDVNELKFDVCIPKKQLLGEPEIGRRFKGNIWLQGYINFSII